MDGGSFMRKSQLVTREALHPGKFDTTCAPPPHHVRETLDRTCRQLTVKDKESLDGIAETLSILIEELHQIRRQINRFRRHAPTRIGQQPSP
jgi:hypothetical protein